MVDDENEDNIHGGEEDGDDDDDDKVEEDGDAMAFADGRACNTRVSEATPRGEIHSKHFRQ